MYQTPVRFTRPDPVFTGYYGKPGRCISGCKQGTEVEKQGMMVDFLEKLVLNQGTMVDLYGRIVKNQGMMVDFLEKLVLNQGITVDLYGRMVENQGRAVVL